MQWSGLRPRVSAPAAEVKPSLRETVAIRSSEATVR